MSVKEQIRPTVEGPLAALGLLVEDVAVTPAGRRRLVRVWIDRALEADAPEVTEPTPSLTLDEVADATRVVSDALDASDVMGEQPYTLEVTSPGVDRPLTQPRHFQRNVSRLVAVTPVEGEPLTGRIVRAGQDSLTVEVPATRKQPAREQQLRYADVSRAVVQVEFSRGRDEHEQVGDEQVGDEHGGSHDKAAHDEHDRTDSSE